jgi:hypothetical protein
MQVKVKMHDGEQIYSGNQLVEHHCRVKLASRFFLGKRVSVHTGQLAAELGTISDTDVAKQIVDGSYTFPPDFNPAMVDLVMEIARLKLEFEDIPPANNDITV